MSPAKKISQSDSNDLPIISFGIPEEWRQWLDKNYDSLKGIWLRLYKKGSGVASVNYDEALDESLCYGRHPFLYRDLA